MRAVEQGIVGRGIRDAERGAWNETDPEEIPSLEDAYKLWDEDIRTVETSTTSELITLTIEWKDREQAARRHSRVQDADDATGMRSAELVRRQRRQQPEIAAEERAVHNREQSQAPELSGNRPPE